MVQDVLSFIHTFHPHLGFLFSVCQSLPVGYFQVSLIFQDPFSPSLTATCHLCVVLFTGQDVCLPLLPLVLLFFTGVASAPFTFNQWQTSEGTVAFFWAFLSNFQNGEFTPIICLLFIHRGFWRLYPSSSASLYTPFILPGFIHSFIHSLGVFL